MSHPILIILDGVSFTGLSEKSNSIVNMYFIQSK